MRNLLVFSAFSGALLSSCAQAAPPISCLDLKGPEAKATIAGKLTIQIFAGAPNYESIAKGDDEEQAFIIELPERMCADDGDFIEPSEPFDRVQVSSYQDELRRVLSASVGREVVVRGEAFGAQTGHHHAPLVLFAEEVTVK
jgi:hypothetical protein